MSRDLSTTDRSSSSVRAGPGWTGDFTTSTTSPPLPRPPRTATITGAMELGLELRTGVPVWFILTLLMVLRVPQHVHTQRQDTKVASQCFHHHGTSFVSLFCGLDKMVRVRKAFHGAHLDFTNGCGHEEGDCTVDMMSEYDWSRCESRHSCVQLVKQLPTMAGCEGLRSTYLQVRYVCVPGSEAANNPPRTISPSSDNEDQLTADTPQLTDTLETKVKAANICLNKTIHMPQVYIQSPGYPEFYPTGLDCRCDIIAPDGDTVLVTFTDVMLAPYKELCGDWLMLGSPDFPGASVVMCEDKPTGKHSLQSRSNHVMLHFHAEPSLGIKDMKGFIVKVTASSTSQLGMQCYKTTAASALSSIPPGTAIDPKRPFALPPTDFGTKDPTDGAPCCQNTTLQLLLLVTAVQAYIVNLCSY